MELPQNEDGTYSTDVNIVNFNFVLGEYHIHVYAVNTDGQQYFLGEGIESVQQKDEKYKTVFRFDFLEIYFSWNYKHTCGDNSNVRSI